MAFAVRLMTNLVIILAIYKHAVCLVYLRKPSKCKKYPCLIFRDNFNTLDFQIWEHLKTASHTGNKEFQYYTNNRTNSYIKDRCLYLKPTLTNDTYDDNFLTSGALDLWGTNPFSDCTTNQCNGCVRIGTNSSIISPIQSAGLRTIKSFSFKFGKVNIRAKLPKGDWLWPAFWLMPKYNGYGDWPASGEIDIMVSRGNNLYYENDLKNVSLGNDHITQSLHWGPYFPEDRNELTSVHYWKEKGTFSDSFHLFSVDITPNGIFFSIYNESTMNVTLDKGGFWKLGNFSENIHNPWASESKVAPFDQEFFIIMNLAVGGNNGCFHENFKPSALWDNDEQNHGKLMKQFCENRNKWLPTWKGENTALKIDYVEVWKQEKDPE